MSSKSRKGEVVEVCGGHISRSIYRRKGPLFTSIYISNRLAAQILRRPRSEKDFGKIYIYIFSIIIIIYYFIYILDILVILYNSNQKACLQIKEYYEDIQQP